ncbi:glutamine amidotransferase [Galactobacter caseinivorans]|uniref:Glutamine amidotransferase n=1 Tax=Galactobacter caseinivorans TaxID=2676123 RepID=A0A496PHC9_9MICC|nr:glutamine amidotransferase [Galactobacter caseinivorans]RKW69888.1 glutamine amidotransferase [Galactobacter caseinivorans]
MKPYLLLSTRTDDVISADELRSVTELSGLAPEYVEQWRLERMPLPPVLDAAWLAQYSGVILGGSPFTSSDTDRSDTQIRVEADLERLLRVVLDGDTAFLGLCYGVGMLARVAGGVVDRSYPEPVGLTTVRVSDHGAVDPLLAGVPVTFDAFVGHKEATSRLPESAVLLASSGPAPVQMYRIGKNVYATQFHPELDGQGLAKRIEAYKHAGYFDPSDAAELTEMALNSDVSHARKVLRNFVSRYQR